MVFEIIVCEAQSQDSLFLWAILHEIEFSSEE